MIKMLRLKILIVFITTVSMLTCSAQGYKDTEMFKNRLQRFQTLSIQDKAFRIPLFFNTDGSHRFYVVDTINADCVDLILEDRNGNMYAVTDNSALLSLKNEDILSSKSIYLFLCSNSMFKYIPKAAKFNAFSDHYYQEADNFGVSTDYITTFYNRPDFDEKSYINYFDKHSHKYGTKHYLEYQIISKPLYYVLLLIEGDVYSSYSKICRNHFDTDSDFALIKFPDPTAYYRVIIPVFQEYE